MSEEISELVTEGKGSFDMQISIGKPAALSGVWLLGMILPSFADFTKNFVPEIGVLTGRGRR